MRQRQTRQPLALAKRSGPSVERNGRACRLAAGRGRGWWGQPLDRCDDAAPLAERVGQVFGNGFNPKAEMVVT